MHLINITAPERDLYDPLKVNNNGLREIIQYYSNAIIC